MLPHCLYIEFLLPPVLTYLYHKQLGGSNNEKNQNYNSFKGIECINYIRDGCTLNSLSGLDAQVIKGREHYARLSAVVSKCTNLCNGSPGEYIDYQRDYHSDRVSNINRY